MKNGIIKKNEKEIKDNYYYWNALILIRTCEKNIQIMNMI